MRFSARLAFPLSQNAYSALISRRRDDGSPLLDLSSSNPTQTLPDYPHSSIAEALGKVSDFTYAPDPFGWFNARSAIAGYYERRGISVPPERIALTASTSEAYSLLFKLLCDPGDEVLVPIPSYPLFEYLAALDSVRTSAYRLRYDGAWHIDFDDLARRISPRTRAIVIVNPNNPTGSLLKRFEAERLLDIASGHGIPVISDEVFMDYKVGEDTSAARTLAGCNRAASFSLNGLSKTCAMPQMKLGWMTLNGPAAELEGLRGRLEVLLDTYLSVNAPVQSALPELFRIGEELRLKLVASIHENLRAVRSILAGSPVHALRVEGGWTAILRLPGLLSEEDWIARLLADYSVVAQPGYFFDMPGEAYIVVSLITPPEVFRAGLERIGSFAMAEAGSR